MLLNWIVPFQMSAVSNGVPEEYSEPGVNEGSYPAFVGYFAVSPLG